MLLILSFYDHDCNYHIHFNHALLKSLFLSLSFALLIAYPIDSKPIIQCMFFSIGKLVWALATILAVFLR